MTGDRLAEDVALIRGLVREAGEIALDYFRGDYTVTRKGAAEEPVTDADLAVDDFLREELTRARPAYGWLSEETEDDRARLDKSRVWIVDPIDGTRAFMRGRDEWVVSVALVENGEPVAGAVYNPLRDEFFEAQRGKGARLNGEKIHVTDCARLEGARLIAYSEFIRSSRWTEPWPDVDAVMVNSIAYRMVLVAAGRFDGNLSVNPKSDWDLAAADLIVQEAGGLATDRTGTPFAYNREKTRHTGVITAPPALHRAIVEKLGDWRPRKRNRAQKE